MSWLVVAKILPPMRVGEPPSYLAIVQESEQDEPVCWTIRLRERTIGWAANRIVRRNDGIADLYSRVYLAELPLDELAPASGCCCGRFSTSSPIGPRQEDSADDRSAGRPGRL